MEKKTPGRPRLYETASDKLDAFRKRQESAGYLRKEILVTKETWEQVSNLAQLHGVGTSDAASGLLEHGLEAFGQEYPIGRESVTGEHSVAPVRPSFQVLPVTFGNALAQGAPEGSARGLRTGTLEASVGASARAQIRSASASFAASASYGAPGTSLSDNPITQFFAKRKDLSNE